MARRGAILGVIIVVAASVGLLTFPLTGLSSADGSFLTVNIVLMCVTAAGATLPLYLYTIRRRLARARALFNPRTGVDWTQC